MKLLKKLWKIIRYWLWKKPVEEKSEPKLTDALKDYRVVIYKNQKINLHKNQLVLFNALSRFDKRAMADRFRILEKKGHIRYEEINGQWICIKNKDYQAKVAQAAQAKAKRYE